MTKGLVGFGKIVRLAGASGPGPSLSARDTHLRRVILIGGFIAAIAIGLLQYLLSDEKDSAGLFLLMVPLVVVNYCLAWVAFDWPRFSRYLLIGWSVALLGYLAFEFVGVDIRQWPVLPITGLYVLAVLLVSTHQLRAIQQAAFQRQHE